MRIRIRSATLDDMPAAITLLRAAQLPTKDLTSANLALVAQAGDRLVGVIGMEPFDDVALLRSLVVSPPMRDKGVARSLVRALESTARRRGVRSLWLLTTDAERFFSRLDFRTQERAAAPHAIRSTAEFRHLCPEDAALMSKTIAKR